MLVNKLYIVRAIFHAVLSWGHIIVLALGRHVHVVDSEF